MFEHSCVASVCENNQQVIVKILYAPWSKEIINSLSERAGSDYPSVHITEGKKSRQFIVFWYTLTHIGVSIDSLHLSRWGGHCG